MRDMNNPTNWAQFGFLVCGIALMIYCFIGILLPIGGDLYKKDGPPNDAGPLSTFRSSTLEDLIAHNMVMVPAEQYEIEKEMVRRYKND